MGYGEPYVTEMTVSAGEEQMFSSILPLFSVAALECQVHSHKLFHDDELRNICR